MAKTNNLHDFLVDLANAIRAKKKYPDSQKINPQDFSDEIDGISGGSDKLAKLVEGISDIEITAEDLAGATAIRAYAFYYHTNLASVTIPNSVKSIGLQAFYNCSNLTSITIKNGATSIGNAAFSGCSKLPSITIPASIQNIGTYAFNNCIKLTTVTFAENSQCSVILDSAFNNCKSLTSITIPSSVKNVEHDAFRICANLTTVTFAENSQCSSIGQTAFYECDSLTSIAIPDSVTSIGHNAFSGCPSLTSIIVAEGNTKYHSSGNCIIETAAKKLVAGCMASVIPADGSVTSIGDYAFYERKSLTSITIPASVQNIGNAAFYYCSKLSSATFEGTPSSIATNAFSSDTALRDIYVPWAQGAVSGAPWGATNATIHYNWTPPSPGGDYTGTYEGYGSYSMRYFKIYDANDSLISSGAVSWSGTVTVPQGGRLVVSANETYGGIYVKVNNLVNCTASEVNSWAETITITPTADNFSFHCEDDFD